jgi:hypothetical protein
MQAPTPAGAATAAAIVFTAVCHALQCLKGDLTLTTGAAPTVCSDAHVHFTFTATTKKLASIVSYTLDPACQATCECSLLRGKG